MPLNPLFTSSLCALLLGPPAQDPVPAGSEAPPPFGLEELEAADELLGLDFSAEDLELMLPEVLDNLESYEALRGLALSNAEPPALHFTPLQPGIEPAPWLPPRTELELPAVQRPADLEELVFAEIPTLASLIRSRRVSCVELAELHLARLRRLDAELHCVITITEERALAQARALDAELAEGRWRGPLHGIPWGAKDLLAVRGYPTTWGAKPFAEQVIDVDATAVQRLDAAGAVLIAKLTLGALAWGDVWYGGRTRNPWNPEQGSSGSSAGPASAVVAGGVVFAIGSETLGSIVSPSERCGASSLRPSFGRVPRTGAMALSWSMDKLGPMCRSLDDAALVLEALVGSDGVDQPAIDLPYRAPGAVDVAGWRVGYPAGAFERAERLQGVLDDLEALGVELVEVELPDYPTGAMTFVLSAEAAAAFDQFVREGRERELVRQVAQAWPNVLRAARLIPAVEYLRANRLRARLTVEFEAALEGLDALVHPSFAGDLLGATNLTGHPTAVAPAGFRDSGTPFGISFTGHLYDEARLMALAGAWQRSTEHHRRHPEL